MSKKTSVFLARDLSRAEAQRRGVCVDRKKRIDRKAWKPVKLGDVLKVCHGKCQHSVESKAGKYPILATSGEIGRTDQFLYDKPSVLIGRKGTIDKPQYIDTPFWTIDTLFYTKIADGYSPKFMFYLCQMVDWASLNEASGVPSLSANRIEALEVCVPRDFDKQLRIVKSLDAVESHINTLQALISKYEAIKKATVNLLLKPKCNWHSIKLKEFESHKNNTCSRSLTTTNSGRIRNIHYGDILVKFKEILSLKDYRIDCLTNEGELRSPADYIQDGDIIIADTAEDETAGKVVEMRDVEDNKAVAGLHTVFLRPPKMLFARGWLGYWMNSKYYHNQLLPYMTGIKVLSLSKSSLYGTLVFYPSMSEQERIVSVFESINSHISILRIQAAKLQKLKDGMMSYFFG